MSWFGDILGTVMAGFFLVGTAGCLFVIPLTAVSLFRAIFEKDTIEEKLGG